MEFHGVHVMSILFIVSGQHAISYLDKIVMA